MSSVEQMRKVLADNEYIPYKPDTRSTRAEDDSEREFRWRSAWELVSRLYMKYPTNNISDVSKNKRK